MPKSNSGDSTKYESDAEIVIPGNLFNSMATQLNEDDAEICDLKAQLKALKNRNEFLDKNLAIASKRLERKAGNDINVKNFLEEHKIRQKKRDERIKELYEKYESQNQDVYKKYNNL